MPLMTRWTIAALRPACARSRFPPAMARTCRSPSFLGLWATGDRTSRAFMAPPPQRVHASQGDAAHRTAWTTAACSAAAGSARTPAPDQRAPVLLPARTDRRRRTRRIASRGSLSVVLIQIIPRGCLLVHQGVPRAHRGPFFGRYVKLPTARMSRYQPTTPSHPPPRLLICGPAPTPKASSYDGYRGRGNYY